MALWSAVPPLLLGDTRNTTLQPYNVVYSKQLEVLKAIGLRPVPEYADVWAHPIVGRKSPQANPKADLTTFSTKAARLALLVGDTTLGQPDAAPGGGAAANDTDVFNYVK
eukprot:Selendium_serpulae@DN5803_c2_g2_i2.p3